MRNLSLCTFGMGGAGLFDNGSLPEHSVCPPPHILKRIPGTTSSTTPSRRRCHGSEPSASSTRCRRQHRNRRASLKKKPKRLGTLPSLPSPALSQCLWLHLTASDCLSRPPPTMPRPWCSCTRRAAVLELGCVHWARKGLSPEKAELAIAVAVAVVIAWCARTPCQAIDYDGLECPDNSPAGCAVPLLHVAEPNSHAYTRSCQWREDGRARTLKRGP